MNSINPIIEMDYTDQELSMSCQEKVEELIEKYFPNFIHEAAYVRPETVSEQYDNDLPRRIEDEYREWLRQKYARIKADGALSFGQIIDREGERGRVDNNYLNEYLPKAKRDAEVRTLGERIAKSNHRDVTNYKALLREYTKELLKSLTLDLLEDVQADLYCCR